MKPGNVRNREYLERHDLVSVHLTRAAVAALDAAAEADAASIAVARSATIERLIAAPSRKSKVGDP